MVQQEVRTRAGEDRLLRIDQAVVRGIEAADLDLRPHAMNRRQSQIAAEDHAEVFAAAEAGVDTRDGAEGRELHRACSGGQRRLRGDSSGCGSGERNRQKKFTRIHPTLGSFKYFKIQPTAKTTAGRATHLLIL